MSFLYKRNCKSKLTLLYFSWLSARVSSSIHERLACCRIFFVVVLFLTLLHSNYYVKVPPPPPPPLPFPPSLPPTHITSVLTWPWLQVPSQVLRIPFSAAWALLRECFSALQTWILAALAPASPPLTLRKNTGSSLTSSTSGPSSVSAVNCLKGVIGFVAIPSHCRRRELR